MVRDCNEHDRWEGDEKGGENARDRGRRIHETLCLNTSVSNWTRALGSYVSTQLCLTERNNRATVRARKPAGAGRALRHRWPDPGHRHAPLRVPVSSTRLGALQIPHRQCERNLHLWREIRDRGTCLNAASARQAVLAESGYAQLVVEDPQGLIPRGSRGATGAGSTRGRAHRERHVYFCDWPTDGTAPDWTRRRAVGATTTAGDFANVRKFCVLSIAALTAAALAATAFATAAEPATALAAAPAAAARSAAAPAT